ncbi:hypothetical protein PM082_007431 [Marasmius tenuissimus]|nr:hypothetical protein PM082_007431 [Marasmius tenuissimus]
MFLGWVVWFWGRPLRERSGGVSKPIWSFNVADSILFLLSTSYSKHPSSYLSAGTNPSALYLLFNAPSLKASGTEEVPREEGQAVEAEGGGYREKF